MLKKIVTLSLAVLLVVQIMLPTALAVIDEEIRFTDIDSLTELVSETNVFNDGLDFYDWTEVEREQFSTRFSTYLSPLHTITAMLQTRAEFVINYLVEGSTVNLLNQLIESYFTDFVSPTQDLNMLVFGELISFADANAQLDILVEIGLDLISAFEIALNETTFTFYDWTEVEREQFSTRFSTYLSPIHTTTAMLQTRAESVINYLVEGSTVDLLNQLIESYFTDFVSPTQDLNMLVFGELISFADANAQLDILVEIGLDLISAFEIALNETIFTFYDWTEVKREQFSTRFSTYLSPIHTTTAMLQIRAEFVVNYLVEGSTVDLLNQLIESYFTDFVSPTQDLNMLVFGELISFADANAQLDILVETGLNLVDEFQNTLWQHHSSQLETSHNQAEGWYLLALDLYEGEGISGAVMGAMGILIAPTNQDLLADLIAEYRATVADMEIVTEIENGNLVPNNDLDFEDVLDSVEEIVVRFDSLSFRFEQLIGDSDDEVNYIIIDGVVWFIGDWTLQQVEIWFELVAENDAVRNRASDLWEDAILNPDAEELNDLFWQLFSESLEIILSGPTNTHPPTLSFEDATALLIANTLALEELIARYENIESELQRHLAPTDINVIYTTYTDDSGRRWGRLEWLELTPASGYRIYIRNSVTNEILTVEVGREAIIDDEDIRNWFMFDLRQLILSYNIDYYLQLRALGDGIDWLDSELSQPVTYRRLQPGEEETTPPIETVPPTEPETEPSTIPSPELPIFPPSRPPVITLPPTLPPGETLPPTIPPSTPDEDCVVSCDCPADCDCPVVAPPSTPSTGTPGTGVGNNNLPQTGVAIVDTGIAGIGIATIGAIVAFVKNRE